MLQEPVSRRLWAVGGHANYHGPREDRVQDLPFITTKKLADLALEYVFKNLNVLGSCVKDIPLELRHHLEARSRHNYINCHKYGCIRCKTAPAAAKLAFAGLLRQVRNCTRNSKNNVRT